MVMKERKIWIEEELSGCDFGDARNPPINPIYRYRKKQINSF